METAFFNKENELLGVFASKKEGREALKGVKDVKMVTAKDFQPIGSYDTVESLFPGYTAPVAAEPKDPSVELAPRNKYEHPELTGPYVIVGINHRVPEGDTRHELIDALATSSSFEEYFSKVPKAIVFVSGPGKSVNLTAKQFLRHALKSNWIRFPDGSKEDEKMQGIRATYAEIRNATQAKKRAEKAAQAEAQTLQGYTPVEDTVEEVAEEEVQD